MAKLYFNTALLLSEILIFVNGRTTSSLMSTSISRTSSLSNSSTSTSTFSSTSTQNLSGVDTSSRSSSSLISNVLVSSSTLTQDLSSTTVAVDPSSRSPSSLINNVLVSSSTLTQDLSSTTVAVDPSSRSPSSLINNVLVSSSTLTQDLSSTTVAVDPSSRSPSSLINNVLVSSSTLTQDLSSTTVAVDPSSRSPSSFDSDSMSVTSSSSFSSSVSTIAPSSSQTTVTSAPVPPTTQVPSTGQPSTSTSLPPGISVTIILYVKVEACGQTAGLDAQIIEASIRVVFARNSELSVKVTLNECDNGAYVKVTIIVRFPVQINFNVATVLRKSLSDNGNKLNGEDALIIDTNRIDVSYTGLNIKFTVRDGECGRVCCDGPGGQVKLDVACTATSSDASCDNISDTIEEEDHCPNEPYDSCSSVCNQGNQAGFIYSPSLAILILLAVASFLKFGFF